MFQVKKLFLVNNSTINVYTPDKYTPLEFQRLKSLSNGLYISVYHPKVIEGRNTNYFGIDFTDLIRDQHMTDCATWDELCSRLTEELAIGYSRKKIPGYGHGDYYPDKQVTTYDVMGCAQDFTVNYADHNTNKEGIFAIRHTLYDLAITSNTYDISNCVPVVNGFTCFPVYNEQLKKLYAVGGARLCWNQTGHVTPEVQLLNFADMGGIFISKLYWYNTDARLVSKEVDTTVYFDNNTNDQLTLKERWLFRTPYSLYEYTPILVICGILIYPDEYFIISENIFRLDIQKLPLNKALALRAYLTDTINSDSGNTYGNGLDLATFLSKALSYPLDLSMQLFAIVIKKHRVYVSRDRVDVWCRGYSMNSFAQNGLLHNIKNGCLENYHVFQMRNHKELSIQTREDTYLVDRAYDSNQVAYTNADCVHHFSELINKTKDCEMVYLMA